MVSCWSQCTPTVSFQNKLFGCFIFHFKNRDFFLERTLTYQRSVPFYGAQPFKMLRLAVPLSKTEEVPCQGADLETVCLFRHNVSA